MPCVPTFLPFGKNYLLSCLYLINGSPLEPLQRLLLDNHSHDRQFSFSPLITNFAVNLMHLLHVSSVARIVENQSVTLFEKFQSIS